MKHKMLEYLKPLKFNRLFAKHFMLHDISGDSCVRLKLSKQIKKQNFEKQSFEKQCFDIKLTKKNSAASSMVGTKHLDLALSLQEGDKSSREIDLLVLAIAKILERNMLDITDDELNDLFKKNIGHDLSAIDSTKRIDFTVGHKCNSHCRFCTDQLTTGLYKNLSTENLFDQFKQGIEKGYKSAVLTGNEPTLRSDLPELILKAKELGYHDVQVITNGFRVADMAYLRELKDSGLTVLIVSIHSPDRETEAKITGQDWLFDKKIKALENARELFGNRQEQRFSGVFFRSNSVITKYGLHKLGALVDLLDELESSVIPLNYPWIHGLAIQNFLEVVPNYQEVQMAIEPFKQRLSDERDPLVLLNLPPCVSKSFKSRSFKSKNVSSDQNTLDVVPYLGDNKAVPITQNLMDSTLIYPDICKVCAKQNECKGVSRIYLEHYKTLGLKAFK